jgi:hypothetical protein
MNTVVRRPAGDQSSSAFVRESHRVQRGERPRQQHDAGRDISRDLICITTKGEFLTASPIVNTVLSQLLNSAWKSQYSLM